MTEIVFHPLIIPSVVIPFTALLAALSALATFIAALFGIKLKAEGPKKLLEVMLKPRVLFVALVSNLVLIGAVQGYRYWKNAPVSYWLIERRHAERAKPLDLVYAEAKELSGGSKFSGQGKLEVLWTKQLDAGSFRGAIKLGPSLFVGTDAGLVHEINPGDGEIRRDFYLGTAVSAAPAFAEGALFVGEGVHDTHSARLYKYNLKSGALEGAFSGAGHIEGDPVVDSGLVFIPSGADGLHAVDAATLAPRWHARDGHVDASVRVADGMVFSGTGIEKDVQGGSKGLAIAYELATGKQIWKRELPASSWMRPIAWKDQICFVYGEVYFASELGGVNCFRRADGAPAASFNNAAPIAAAPILVGEDLVTADLHGKVCRVFLSTGLPRWCRSTERADFALSNPVFDPRHGVLIYPAQKAGLYVIHSETGEVLAQWKAEGEKLPWASTFAPVALLEDGWVIVDMKGVMRKLRWGVGALATNR